MLLNFFTQCKVCKGFDLELCNGEILGLDTELVIRCGGYDKLVTKIEKSLKYLRCKYKNAASKSICERKEKKRKEKNANQD